MRSHKKVLGFTLLELMIALVIIGIVAAAAIPSYQKSVISSNRVSAQVDLMDAAQRLQRCYTAYGSFTNVNCPVYGKLLTGYTSGGKGYYRIDFDPDTPPKATTYKLRATAILKPQLNDYENCRTLGLDSTGVKYPAPVAGKPDCWKK